MANILLINGHQPFPTSPGKLNAFYLERARARFASEGHATRLVRTSEAYDLETEVESQQWADLIFLQFPVNSMGAPWSLKKYLDEVYTAGMDGRLVRLEIEICGARQFVEENISPSGGRSYYGRRLGFEVRGVFVS